MRATDLRIYALREVRLDLIDAATTAEVRRTIIGASTLTVDLPARFLTARIDTVTHARAAGRRWEYVAIENQPALGSFRLTFEDRLINRLRQDTSRFTTQAAQTAGDIITAFCLEADVPVTVDPLVGQVYIEGAGRSILKPTNSWIEIAALADRLGARAFSTGDSIIVARDTELLAADSTVIRPSSPPLRADIAFTIDTARDQSTARVDVAPNWTLEPGSVVRITRSGPANGRWLVDTWTHPIPEHRGAGQIHLTRPTR